MLKTPRRCILITWYENAPVSGRDAAPAAKDGAGKPAAKPGGAQQKLDAKPAGRRALEQRSWRGGGAAGHARRVAAAAAGTRLRGHGVDGGGALQQLQSSAAEDSFIPAAAVSSD